MRESLQHLGATGLVRARPRAGTVVQPRERWNLLRRLPSFRQAGLRFQIEIIFQQAIENLGCHLGNRGRGRDEGRQVRRLGLRDLHQGAAAGLRDNGGG
ncbi:hypothetical protein [Paracoccus benzoatiresistens]|uniref:hypothetical protein n=1 Tax=Paracoccus benzoatiresistens TaxID=2997341 RepID=UPI0035302DF4